MDGMKYDFGALDALADTIDGRVKNIESQLSDLKSKISNLTSIWVGAADEGFQATRTKWDGAADDLNRVLHQIAVAVKTTNSEAQQTENTNKARW